MAVFDAGLCEWNISVPPGGSSINQVINQLIKYFYHCLIVDRLVTEAGVFLSLTFETFRGLATKLEFFQVPPQPSFFFLSFSFKNIKTNDCKVHKKFIYSCDIWNNRQVSSTKEWHESRKSLGGNSNNWKFKETPINSKELPRISKQWQDISINNSEPIN